MTTTRRGTRDVDDQLQLVLVLRMGAVLLP